jgi:hypothetical protein
MRPNGLLLGMLAALLMYPAAATAIDTCTTDPSDVCVPPGCFSATLTADNVNGRIPVLLGSPAPVAVRDCSCKSLSLENPPETGRAGIYRLEPGDTVLVTGDLFLAVPSASFPCGIRLYLLSSSQKSPTPP